MQCDERTAQTIAHILHLLRPQLVLKLASKPVCFPLKVAADRIHADADNGFERRQDHLQRQSGPWEGKKKFETNLEQKKCDNSGRLCGDGLAKVEGAKEGRGMQEGREERQDGEDM